MTYVMGFILVAAALFLVGYPLYQAEPKNEGGAGHHQDMRGNGKR